MDKLGQIIKCKNLILLPWLQPWVSWRLYSIKITAHITNPRKTIGFLGGANGKEPACQCSRLRDMDSILGLGRCPGEGNGSALQYSCLENPMDRGAWRGIVHRITPRGTQLKWLSTGKLRTVYTPLDFVKPKQPSIEMS